MRAREEMVQQGRRFALTQTIPAPVKGWNTIDPLAAMDPQYAVALDNWIPQPSYIACRGGSQAWATSLPAAVQSLIPYIGQGESRLFAAAQNGFYDITAGGGIGLPVYSISSSKNWVSQPFETLAGMFVTAANGIDPVANFDGTSWSASAITGVASTSLNSVTNYQGRLWYGQKNTLSAWYLGPGDITGAATQFNFGTQVKRGGTVLAVGTWAIDAGDGPLAYLLFVTSEGEIVVYQGTDPSQSSTFGFVGTYRVPKPIGPNCLLQYGGDTLILTQQGVYPLSKALLSSTLDRSSAVTYTISSQFAADYANGRALYGWSMTLFTEANLLLVNVPGADPNTGGSAQYVMNTLTGAWCRFLGLNSTCWCEFEGSLYFGETDPEAFLFDTNGVGNLWNLDGSGTVLEAETAAYGVSKCLVGLSDNGLAITTNLLTAYNYFEQPLSQKQVKLVRPTIQTNDSLMLFMALSLDYQPIPQANFLEIDYNINTPAGGGFWDISDWDDCTWQAAAFNPLQWCSPVAPVGFAVAIGLQTMTDNSQFTLASFDIAYEQGVGIL